VIVAPLVSMTAAERACVPPGLIASAPRPLLAAFVAVSVIEVTGQVANGTAGLLTPAVEAKMLAWPGPIGVTVPAVEVPVVSMVAIVVSLVVHWKGLTVVLPAVRSAVMSQGADRDLGVQTDASLLKAFAWNCGSEVDADEPDTKDNDVQVHLVFVAQMGPLDPTPGPPVITTLSTFSCT
jgi:predicted secreted protein